MEQVFFDNKILVNKNLIPNDRKTPLNPSGIRIAVTCITILEYTDNDIYKLSNIIANIINHKEQIFSIQELINNYKYRLISPVR
jgi:glycine/serine hydroxymethyltransferase